MNIYSKILRKFENIVARLSPEEIGLENCTVNLYFTKLGTNLPYIKINVNTTNIHSEECFSVSIIGTIDETENKDLKFADLIVDRIIKDYKHLRPIITEGILHSISSDGNSSRTASRSLVVKYRMFDRLYEADEYYNFDINENEIAESVLLYIISMQDIYSRIYRTS